jgi:hypothetical protein
LVGAICRDPDHRSGRSKSFRRELTEAAWEQGADAAAGAGGIRHPLAGVRDLGKALGDHATPLEVASQLLLGEPGQFE